MAGRACSRAAAPSRRDGGITIASLQSTQGAAARLGTGSLRLPVLAIEASLTSRAYDALREAIAEMPIYDGTDDDIRLDERALAERLGISRTPVRAALQRLETEGVVQTIPRRGIYVVRKTKAEIIEVILASAALEGMAARLAAERATGSELEAVLDRFPGFRPGATVPVLRGRDRCLLRHQPGVPPADRGAGPLRAVLRSDLPAEDSHAGDPAADHRR